MLRAFAIAAIGVLALAAQSGFPVRTTPPRTPEVGRILERADAGKDGWIGEQDYEALNSWIQKNKAALPWPAGTTSRFSKLTLTELKIIASNRADAAESNTTLRLRVELGGVGRDGRRLSLLGHASASFAKQNGEWRLDSFTPGALRELSGPAAPRFTDVTAKALGHNVSYRHQLARGLDEWRMALDEATGIDVYGHNGVAVGDYNNDGLDDFYVAQPSGLPNRLYRNNGDGTFDDVSAAAGVDLLDPTSMALFADLDNDGDQDLVLVAGSRLILLVNDGRGAFTPHATPGFVAPTGTLTSAALADMDRDGDLDLYVCAYDFWTPGVNYAAPTPYYDATNGPPNFLYRNRGDGTFEDVTAASGMNENNNRFSFAAAWADYDRDGFPDLYVANDFGRNNLYRNNGDGTFRDVAAKAGVEDLGAGMSASWGDYDGDGWLDLYVSNMWSSAGQRLTFNPAFESVAGDADTRAAFQRQARGNSLYRNNHDGTFTDVTLTAGVEFGRWAWASSLFDYDNDGRLDIFVTNGYITGPDTHDL
ncbi:MAG: VCBS repeat-containing protein [Bryobacterales bacterium]|nr:VCBS repeat-containing protein [Bryobacterales bacterium]